MEHNAHGRRPYGARTRAWAAVRTIAAWRMARRLAPSCQYIVWGVVFTMGYAWLAAPAAWAQILVLKNGMELRGKMAAIGSVGSDVLSPTGSAGEVDLDLILLVDDGLRRTYVSTYQKHNLLEDVESFERLELPNQPVARYGPRVGKLGALLETGRFDRWGRRVVLVQGDDGPVSIIQGITEITPLWTKLESLQARPTLQWESRMATSSLPQRTLSEVLETHVSGDDAQRRLAVVRLFIQAERYQDAERQLRETLRDFPELQDLQQRLTELQQLKARQWLQEIRNMQTAGRHRQAWTLLRNFPTENMAGELLAEVSGLLAEYDRQAERGREVIRRYREHAAQWAAAQGLPVAEDAPTSFVTVIQQELETELSINTLDRMADFLRLADDPELSSEQKLALAVSGWILGSGSGTENMGIASSIFQVRRLVREYLRTDAGDEVGRQRILGQLASLEGSDPERVSKVIAHMQPPYAQPAPAEEAVAEPGDRAAAPVAEAAEAAEAGDTPPGLYRLTVPGLVDGEPFEYWIQLPPEYDPYRRYPAVVTLHGAGSSPRLQIDWWAGSYHADRGQRIGQATRHGYIVIAPAWADSDQVRYRYSAREHAVVTFALRDALRRFAIDTDRVFLSGHSLGGDAAWDIGLSHPDLWAGVLPVVASSYEGDPQQAARYVSLYWRNARHLPLYFVSGALDADRNQRNASDWDRYLSKPHFDVMISEYLGRGHEHFSDDIQRMFTWMNAHRRDFHPHAFEATSMRTWDNFFWWLELEQFPERFVTYPTDWPPARGQNAAQTEAEMKSPNFFVVKTPVDQVQFWLSPEMIDFDQPIRLHIGGRSMTQEVRPKLETLLEDVRTRGDRQHPFWARWTIPLGRQTR